MLRKTLVFLLAAALLCAAAPMSLAASADASAVTEAGFPDVTDPAVQLAAAVLRGFGVVDGYEDGTFRPDATLTRAEFCKLAVMAMGLGGEVSANARRSLFTDVQAGHWAAGYVNLCSRQGVVNGYGDGRFGPGDSVTCAQALTILLRLLGYTAQQVGDSWPEDYLLLAARLGLDEGLDLSANDALSRGDAALLLYRLLGLDTVAGQAYYETLPDTAATVSGALLLSAEGTELTYRAENGQQTAAASYPVSPLLAGLRGTLLLNQAGAVLGFLPDTAGYAEVTVYTVDAETLTDTDGAVWDLTGAKLYGAKTAYSCSAQYLELLPGSTVRLYFDENNRAAAVWLPEFDTPQVARQAADAVLLTVSGSRLTYLSGGETVQITAAAGFTSQAGQRGTLLLDKAGAALGFLPEESGSALLTVATVQAAGLTAQDGSFYAAAGSAQVCMDGEVSAYAAGWHNIPLDTAARLFLNEQGEVSLVYLSGGGSAGDYVVLSAADASLVPGYTQGMAVVKNGCAAALGDLARNDVAAVDPVTGVLTASDRRVTGYLSAVGYTAGEPTSVTVMGTVFPLLDSAAADVAAFSVGSRVTLLLAPGGAAAAVLSASTLQADMLGILSLDGRGGASVALGGGVTVSGQADGVDAALSGSLVTVTETAPGTLYCTLPESGVTGGLDLSANTAAGHALAPWAVVYDWAGKGAAIAVSLEDVDWTKTVAAADISYIHLNAAGQADLVLLRDVTGDAWQYGLAVTSSETQQVQGGGWTHENVTHFLSVNCGGTISAAGSGAYSLMSGTPAGVVVLGDGSLYRSQRLYTAAAEREAFTGVSLVQVEGADYAIADGALVYDEDSESWMTLEEGLSRFTKFTLCYDRPAAQGGKVRLLLTA